MKTIVSYHPISEKEIHTWYYNVDFSLVAGDVNYSLIKIARADNMEDEYLKKYIKTMKKAVKLDISGVFDTTHGFFIAKIQTYFRQYFVVKSSFSELIAQKEHFKDYTKPWESILENTLDFTFLNKLSDTPSSGIYIPNEKISSLLKDYEGNLIVKKDIDGHFGSDGAKAFVESLIYAQDNNVGLLEANGVKKPETSSVEVEDTVETTKAVKVTTEVKEEKSDVENQDAKVVEKKSLFYRFFSNK